MLVLSFDISLRHHYIWHIFILLSWSLNDLSIKMIWIKRPSRSPDFSPVDQLWEIWTDLLDSTLHHRHQGGNILPSSAVQVDCRNSANVHWWFLLSLFKITISHIVLLCIPECEPQPMWRLRWYEDLDNWQMCLTPNPLSCLECIIFINLPVRSQKNIEVLETAYEIRV